MHKEKTKDHQHSNGMMMVCLFMFIGVMVLIHYYPSTITGWFVGVLVGSHVLMMIVMAKRHKRQGIENSDNEVNDRRID